MVDLHPQIGIPTGASSIHESERKDSTIRLTLLKFYRLLFTRWRQRKKSSSSDSTPDHKRIQDVDTTAEPSDIQLPRHSNAVSELPRHSQAAAHKVIEENSDQEETMHGVHSYRYKVDHNHDPPTSPGCFFRHRSGDHSFHFPLSRSSSRRKDNSPTPSLASSLFRSGSRKSGVDESTINGFPASLSRNASRRSTTTPIMFSNSTGLVKPPTIQKNLECTLEELCFGCTKKIKITRDVISDAGQVNQEEELLSIKVKPGWKKGTKITFEGMGNEVPGSLPADITFVIAEKRHHMFRREGDDLELVVDIPLVNALTGCAIPIPLLGGEKMDLSINEIVHPGQEKVIKGQGMPTKDERTRGDLKLHFLVNFPKELTNDQRSDVLSILEGNC
ncbi:dnaJ homolog subfamily B member 4-like [Pistacia vera]|uniref:dnaJ homolog subfamily B member 4-like n=1 Tax=Pistacia vera TaxID=55513 RepID=UPI001262EC06|nr:dnaJ homolog subfamily B member 4-like [Pistacia vera]